MTIGGTNYGYHTAEIDRWWERPQKRVIRGDGSVLARDLEPESEFRTYELRRLSKAQTESLEVALRLFANGTVTVVDDFGMSFTGRFWDKRLHFQSRVGGMWSANITFRVG